MHWTQAWARLTSLVATIGHTANSMSFSAGDPGQQDILRQGVRSLGSGQFEVRMSLLVRTEPKFPPGEFNMALSTSLRELFKTRHNLLSKKIYMFFI